ncbi:SemiSWEET transporter [Geomonas sp. RF6]|uniref:SemiSWEET family sugar transporter n=1 Tax=Geomonas sp. RF6 TaxID=2897342 RepID=UPI001E312AF4|nr:SemiSWEET transporter [Geomonas sp. RF6]UFS69458.1 SemiSWEET transporter [Geomonas sp. RF6]
MTVDTSLGLLAGAITSGAAIPQVLRTFRTKQVRDLSIWQPILLDIGMSLWLAYGLLLNDLPLIAANSFSIICYSALIVMKVRYGREEDLPCRAEFDPE